MCSIPTWLLIASIRHHNSRRLQLLLLASRRQDALGSRSGPANGVMDGLYACEHRDYKTIRGRFGKEKGHLTHPWQSSRRSVERGKDAQARRSLSVIVRWHHYFRRGVASRDAIDLF